MAIIKGARTINGVLFLHTDTDPSAGIGSVPAGSLVLTADGSGVFYKYGILNTDYALLPTILQVPSAILTGYAVGINTPIAAADSILSAFGKTQGQLNALILATHPAVTIGTANGLSIIGATQVLSLGLATAISTGALSFTDWTTFNNKQNAVTWQNVSAASTKITLGGSPIGSVFSAFSIDVNEANLTLDNIGGVLSISKGGTGQVTANAALNALLPLQAGNAGKFLTTDGSNTSWSVNPLGTVTSVSVTTANGISGVVATPTTTPAITLTLGAITPTSVNGITFSGTGSITNTGVCSLTGFTGSGASSGTNTGDQTITLTGEATGSGTGSFAVTLTNSAVIGKVLTGYVSGAGVLAATDSILQAIQKLNGNIGALVTGVSSVSGTANRITSTGGSTPVIDISAAYIGQSSIITLGTITTGVWTGTTIAIANGGTGQITAILAFDALSPLTTKGDLISRDATNNVRLAVGTNGQSLTPDSTATSGLKWVTPASAQSTPADPATTTSTTGVMMGLAGSITPTKSGTVMIVISCDMDNGSNNNGAQIQIRTGTGAAPANGAALTGTVQGSLIKMFENNNTQRMPSTVNAVVTGLTVGTAVWIDLGLAAITGGTARIRDVSISIIEI